MQSCVSVMAFSSPSFTSLCIIIISSLLSTVNCKVYNRCELARELVEVHEIPPHQVATWVCIAYRESGLNTSAVNHGSGDHGLFQISQSWWCSPPGEGYACAISCAALEDDDIEDDVVCARRIFRAHQRISGDGFSAWVVYPHYCKDKEKVKKYVEGCFDSGIKNIPGNLTLSLSTLKETTPSIFPTTETIKSTTGGRSKTILKDSPIITYKYVSTGFIKGISTTTTKTTEDSDEDYIPGDSRNTIKTAFKGNGAEKINRMVKNAYSIFLSPNGFRLTRSDH